MIVGAMARRRAQANVRHSDDQLANRFLRECREALASAAADSHNRRGSQTGSRPVNDAPPDDRSLHRLLLQLIFRRFHENLGLTGPDEPGPLASEWVGEGYNGESAISDPAAPQIALKAIQEILARYSFSPVERMAGDDPVAWLDPTILGRVVEELSPGRHENGAYYTPQPVVAFIVREALTGCLGCGARRFIETRDASTIEYPRELLEKIGSLRICDPACGSGAFLVGVFHELWALRQSLFLRLDLDPAQNDPWAILQHNLHGMDRDPLAIEATRMRLCIAARTKDGAGSSVLRPPSSVIARDSLLNPPACGTFDMVLMNPPYLSRNRAAVGGQAGAARQKALKQRYGFAGDLYVYFLALGLDLLNEKGVLYAITPSSYLTNTTKEPIRRRLLANGLRLLAPLGPNLFPAVVYPCITGVEKGAGDRIRYLPTREMSLADFESGEIPDALCVTRGEYVRSYRTIFYEPSPENRRLFLSLRSAMEEETGRRFAPLNRIAPALDTGIDSGNVRRRLFFRTAGDGRMPRLIQGVQVVRYGCWWENPAARYYYVDIDYQPNPAARGVGRGGKPSSRPEYWSFRGPAENHRAPERILLRQTADEPFAGYLRQGADPVYTDNTIHTLILTEEARYLGITYRYLLGILNSQSFRSMYRQVSHEEGRVLAQVKITIINRLPIPIPHAEERARIEELVQAIQEDGGRETEDEGRRTEDGGPRTEDGEALRWGTVQSRRGGDVAQRTRLLQNALDDAVSKLYLS